ncbi:MAG TPA: bifunctional UDP-2,4-diacetamido-2,4,6-trideoxy-beta-L-altropyranose hydrolase/GNAT family N-acetyltransferase [Actinophytocola sp.]|jgi:spore coat polysaccharide biosynthesis predicted glycosyltransferase SpsG|nr:bifunctional UDP-2,4-diacetamido-2,4,6-trideoxy-beta-L-altropyranose hydrolase/GNAT family N-acetyltransferase [Actinophytocola sp.]
MTTLLLRADAGPSIGVGHVSRCVALAEAAVARGWRVSLAGSVLGADWLLARLSTLDVPVVSPANLTAGDPDVVVVDHYGIGELPDVRAAARLVSLEDGPFGRRAADVVVDANLAPALRPSDGSPLVLAGPRFAPLRSAVVAARRGGSPRSDGSPRVVVVMGGSAAADAVSAALTALGQVDLPMTVRAISPSPLAAPDARFTVEPPTPDLPALLAEADLVISAAGVTLLELCCLGVPAAVVQLADNQSAGYRAAVGQGLAVGLGTVADLPAAAPVLRALLEDPSRRATLSHTASSLVDGRGAERILTASTLTIRPATMSDAGRLLAWRNDPDTLRWSRGHEPVAEPAHRAWLDSSLANSGRVLLVVETGHPIGTVRFDRVEPATWEVGITLAPADRGKGLSADVLMLGEAALLARHAPAWIVANVHEDNVASRTLFRHAGYEPSPRPSDGPYLWLRKSCPQPDK